MGINVKMYSRFKICLPPYFPNRIEKISELRNFVKVGGGGMPVSNSRLFRQKQRTLPWHFDIEHRPGRTNNVADATSRHPSPSSQVDDLSVGPHSEHDVAESALIATIRSDAEEVIVIPWSLIAQATAEGKSLNHI